MNNKVHFYNIDILKFFFAWAIVGFHIVYHKAFNEFGFDYLFDYMKNGNSAVSYFFVISAFFLWPSIDSNIDVFHWSKKRFLRLAPSIAFVTLLFYIFHLYGFWSFNISANLEQILLIRDWSSASRWGQAVHPAWFVSVLMLISLYLIGLKKSISNQNLLYLVIGISMYIGWRMYVLPSDNRHWGSLLGHYDIGKAIFCMGLGCIIYYLYSHNNHALHTKSSKVIWSVIESVLLLLVFQKLFNGKHSRLDELLSILSFTLLLWSFINQKGFIGQILNCKYFQYLGRYSYACFIGHIFVLDSCRKIIFPQNHEYWNNHPTLGLLLIVSLVSILSIIIYHFIEVPINNYLRRQSK